MKRIFCIMTVIFCFHELLAAKSIDRSGNVVSGEFLVKLSSDQYQLVQVQDLLGSQNVRRVTKSVYLVQRNLLERSEFVVSSLKALDQVELVEPNYVYQIESAEWPSDPVFQDQWGLHNTGQNGGEPGVDIGALKAWEITEGSKEIVIAVIDTGLLLNHPDLRNNLWINRAEFEGETGVDDDGNGFVDDIYGYDFANSDADPMDDHGHGTVLAGIAGAEGNNGEAISGVNRRVSLMAIKFLSSGGGGSLENAVRSINYATQMGAHVMINGWGGGSYSEILQSAIEDANEKGSLFVAGAGSEGSDNDVRPMYPASYNVPNVISATAVDRHGQLAGFANFGRSTVTVGAPGVEIVSFGLTGLTMGSGTSMAAAYAGGVAGLLLSKESTLSPAQVKERLIAQSMTLSSLENKVVSGGMVHAFFALSGGKP